MHGMEISEIYSHTILANIFVKALLLVIVLKLLKSWFHEIFLGESNFHVFPHCDIYCVQERNDKMIICTVVQKCSNLCSKYLFGLF